ncbi:MAG TPA: CoA transferase, partial [Gammaproteobacteria bacterium]|nr:CoA transferase [Gammaproteobacteria bacterium]
TKAELQQLLGGKVPFGPVNSVTDIMGDAHFQLRDMLVELDHPGSDDLFTVAGTPLKMSRTPGGVRHRAPLLGEHTAEVLGQLGDGPPRGREKKR